MPPFLIGLTGGIGSGKSTAAAEFARLGADIIVGDELGKKVLDESPELHRQIRRRFGQEVFDSDGTINRRKVGQRIFSNTEDASWLTKETFPRIHRKWLQAVEVSSKKIIVFDAALIFEWGIEREFDLIVLVVANLDNVLRRITDSGRLTAQEAESRLAAQLPMELKAAGSHVIVEKNGTRQDLIKQIHEIWKNRIQDKISDRRNDSHESSD